MTAAAGSAILVGLVSWMEQGIEKEPVGFRLDGRVIDVGPQFEIRHVFLVVVADPITIKIKSSDIILF